MSTQDVIDLVSHLIGGFAIGFAVGFITVTFKKSLDQI